MAIICVGSINIDHVYRVPHLPKPGETLAADSYAKGLGGKGANQSIAAAKAGARVSHLGAIGPEGQFATAQMAEAGVDVSHVSEGDIPTGHAIITVDQAGENAIVLFPGANLTQTDAQIRAGLDGFGPGDSLILQNEVNASAVAARLARERGLRAIYSAAPFVADAAREMLPLIDLLLLNEGEAAALESSLHQALSTLSGLEVIVTRGANGAVWHHDGGTIDQAAYPAPKVVDTTGAGDCFAGYLAAGLDAGLSREDAIAHASAAAALQVSRPGAADAMPLAEEVRGFMEDVAR